MLNRLGNDIGDPKVLGGLIVGVLATIVIGWLAHRLSTRRLREALDQAIKEAQERSQELRDANERLVQQELENNMARLDVLRLIEQLGKREVESQLSKRDQTSEM